MIFSIFLFVVVVVVKVGIGEQGQGLNANTFPLIVSTHPSILNHLSLHHPLPKTTFSPCSNAFRCDPGTELPGGGCRTGQLMPPLATDPEVDVKFHYRLEPTSFSYEFQNLEPGLVRPVVGLDDFVQVGGGD